MSDPRPPRPLPNAGALTTFPFSVVNPGARSGQMLHDAVDMIVAYLRKTDRRPTAHSNPEITRLLGIDRGTVRSYDRRLQAAALSEAAGPAAENSQSGPDQDRPIPHTGSGSSESADGREPLPSGNGAIGNQPGVAYVKSQSPSFVMVAPGLGNGGEPELTQLLISFLCPSRRRALQFTL